MGANLCKTISIFVPNLYLKTIVVGRALLNGQEKCLGSSTYSFSNKK